jgi:hypothetical protein
VVHFCPLGDRRRSPKGSFKEIAGQLPALSETLQSPELSGAIDWILVTIVADFDDESLPQSAALAVAILKTARRCAGSAIPGHSPMQ